MLEVRNEGIILEPTELEFERGGVLNPAVVEVDGITHLWYRAVRPVNFSTIGYCQLKDGKLIKRLPHPFLSPDYAFERQGLEDPRLCKLGSTYYLFYTAYDGKNARIAYATSPDLQHFTKQGLISPGISYDEAEDYFRHSQLPEKYRLFEAYFKDQAGPDVLLWEKDALLFPEKINGRYALLHRVLPGIQVIYFDDFADLTDDYWRAYLGKLSSYVVMHPKHWFESRNIGGGCPPIETPAGWLLIYHAVEDAPTGRVYHASAALLDRHDPTRELSRLSEPLFSPAQPWEREGEVPNVVFPTGAVLRDDRLFIYYGAADSRIAAKSVVLEDLLNALKSST